MLVVSISKVTQTLTYQPWEYHNVDTLADSYSLGGRDRSVGGAAIDDWQDARPIISFDPN